MMNSFVQPANNELVKYSIVYIFANTYSIIINTILLNEKLLKNFSEKTERPVRPKAIFFPKRFFFKLQI